MNTMKKTRKFILNIVNHPSEVIQGKDGAVLAGIIVVLWLLAGGVLLIRGAQASPAVPGQLRSTAAETAPKDDAQPLPELVSRHSTGAITTTHTDIDDTAAPMTDIIIINVPPRPQDASLTTSEDTAVSGQLVATDGNENEVLNYRIIEPPEHGTVLITNITGGDFVYTPTLDFSGTDRFTFRANDGQVDSRTDGTVTMTVTAVNDAPRFVSSPPLTATAKMSYTATVEAVDVDDDALTIRALAVPSWLDLTDNGNGSATLSGRPAAADEGSHTVALRVVDDDGAGSAQQFRLTVLPPDEARLQVRMASSTSTIVTSNVVTYTVVVTNSGPAAARTLAATVTLTDGIAFVAPAAPGGALVHLADGWQCAVAAGSKTTACTRPMLETGASAVITLTAWVTREPGEATVTARVTAANYPADVSPASDRVTLNVLGAIYMPILLIPPEQVIANALSVETFTEK